MSKNSTFNILLCLSIVLISQNVNAQCAMCKAVVEANLQSGGSIGAGLNDGILYLMAMPYISMIVVGLVWYNLKKEPKS
jgi:hypothetical protein|tara:strand:- start:235 stop:471 length:237 start_codon:yes stop_codon:yes gene_type:complete